MSKLRQIDLLKAKFLAASHIDILPGSMDPHAQQGFFNEYVDLKSGNPDGGYNQSASASMAFPGYPAYVDAQYPAAGPLPSQAGWPQEAPGQGHNYSNYGATGLKEDEGYGDDDDWTRSSSTPETKASSRSGTSSKTSAHSKSTNSTEDSKKKAKRGGGGGSSSSSKPSSSSKGKDKDKAKLGAAAEEERKRDRFLERNRVAASKCRMKRKEWVSDLEEHKVGLESFHNNLQMEYQGLLGEVSNIKNQLMQHANCNDSNIDQWLQNEARTFVQGGSDHYEQLYCGHDHGRPGHTCTGYNSESPP